MLPIVLGGRFFPHYFLQLFPPLVVLAASCLASLWDRSTSRSRPRTVAAGLVAAALAVFSGARVESKMSTLRDPEIVSIPHATPKARALAAYVRGHTPPEARILVWGYGSALYHLAQRRPATRFPYVTYLVGAVEGTPTWWSPFHPSRGLEIPRAWTLFFQDLERNPPELVIDTASAGYIAFGKFPIEKYPALLGFLERSYQRAQIEGFTVWRRIVDPRPRNQIRQNETFGAPISREDASAPVRCPSGVPHLGVRVRRRREPGAVGGQRRPGGGGRRVLGRRAGDRRQRRRVLGRRAGDRRQRRRLRRRPGERWNRRLRHRHRGPERWERW